MAALRDMSNVRKNMKKIERRGAQVSDKGAPEAPYTPSPDAFGTSLRGCTDGGDRGGTGGEEGGVRAEERGAMWECGSKGVSDTGKEGEVIHVSRYHTGF